MINIIKDKNGNQVKEPEDRFVIEMIDRSMVEARDFREATAAVVGMEYVDCETAETEWHMRLDAAKGIGLTILANEDEAKTIVYDERIGKIPYSYTDPNPDYTIPDGAELIRIECDETFILTLAKMKYIRVWEKTDSDYKDYLKINDIEHEIEEHLNQFRDKKQSIPLHERI
jgi:hypothetical protein